MVAAAVTRSTTRRALPPLWLACAAVASAWGAVFSVARWISGFQRDPANIDFSPYYYAAVLGLEQGWSKIYDQPALQAVVAHHLSGSDAVINSSHTFPNAPLLAWIIVPLTVLPYGPALIAWTLLGVAAVVWTWWVAKPYSGLAGLTLLFAAMALWPIHYSLVLGQPIPEILALVAAAWWLTTRDHPVEGGLALALATALKPQDVILVPFVLLLAGHRRLFAAWAVGCAVLGLAFAASLGVSGVVDFWNTTVEVEANPWHHYWTWVWVAGPGLPAVTLQAGSAAAAVVVAWRNRSSIELVIAAGLIGSILSAVHEHETDAAMLVLAAWFVLRSESAGPARWWLLPGIVAIQAMSIGLVWPFFIWTLVWLLLLGAKQPDKAAITGFKPRRASP